MSLSSTNMAKSEKNCQGRRAIPTQYRKASDILTSTLAAFLFSSHPRKERDREAHLNYNASAGNRERQPSHHKTKLNKYQHKESCIPNTKIQKRKIEPQKNYNPDLVAFYGIRSGNRAGLY